MKNIKKKNTKIAKLLLTCVLTLTLLPLSAMIAVADDAPDGVSPFDQTKIYPAWVNYELSESDNQLFEADVDTSKIRLADIGAFLGAIPSSVKSESSVASSALSGTISETSNNSYQTSYSALSSGIKMGNRNSSLFYRYVRFGYALKDLGIDVTSNEAFSSSKLTTYSMKFGMFLLSLSEQMDEINSWLISGLKYLNPAEWFARVNDGFYKSLLQDENASPVLESLTSTVSGVLTALYHMSVNIMIPLALGLAIVKMIDHRVTDFSQSRSEFGQPIWNFAKKAFWILIGIPLTLSLYTSALNYIADSLSSSEADVAVYDEIGKSFLDFSSWAMKRQLEIPSNYKIVSEPSGDDGTIGGKAYVEYNGSKVTTDKLILAINQDVGSYPTGDDTTAKKKAAEALINRYANNEAVTSADLKSYWSSRSEASLSDDYTDKLADLYGSSDESKIIDPYNAAVGTSIFNNGNMASSDTGDDDDLTLRTFKFSKAKSNDRADCVYGLSTAALYNFLSSDFGSNTVTYYSPDGGSTYTNLYHRAVTIPAAFGNSLAVIGAAIKALSAALVETILIVSLIILLCKKVGGAIMHGTISMFGNKKSIIMFIGIVVASVIDILVVSLLALVASSVVGDITGAIKTALDNTFGVALADAGVSDVVSSILEIVLSVVMLVVACKYCISIVKYIDAFIESLAMTVVGNMGGGGAANGAGAAAKAAVANGGGGVKDMIDGAVGAGAAGAAALSSFGDKTKELGDKTKELGDKIRNAPENIKNLPKSMQMKKDAKQAAKQAAKQQKQANKNARAQAKKESAEARKIAYGRSNGEAEYAASAKEEAEIRKAMQSMADTKKRIKDNQKTKEAAQEAGANSMREYNGVMNSDNHSFTYQDKNGNTMTAGLGSDGKIHRNKMDYDADGNEYRMVKSKNSSGQVTKARQYTGGTKSSPAPFGAKANVNKGGGMTRVSKGATRGGRNAAGKTLQRTGAAVQKAGRVASSAGKTATTVGTATGSAKITAAGVAASTAGTASSKAGSTMSAIGNNLRK